MTPPFFVEQEQHPVLNTTRILETVIGAVFISLITGSAMFYVVTTTTDAVMTQKMDTFAKSVEKMSETVTGHMQEDSKFRLEVTRMLSRHQTKIETLEEKD